MLSLLYIKDKILQPCEPLAGLEPTPLGPKPSTLSD